MSNLLAGYQAGDVEAFRELYSSLRPLLAARLLACGADEGMLDPLLDEVFLRIHDVRRTWSPGCSVERWAMAIAEHVFLTEGRRSALPPARGGSSRQNSAHETRQTVQNAAEPVRQVRR